jgi:hypothetical protein
MKLPNFLKDKRKRLVIGLIIVVGLMAAIRLSVREPPLKISQTDPQNGQKDVDIDQIITLNLDQRKAIAADWEISFFPQVLLKKETEDNLIRLTPLNPLKNDTLYKVEIRHQKIKDFYYSFSFTTLPAPQFFEKGLGDPDFAQRHEQVTEKYYPLLKYYPIKEKNWSAYYDSPTKFIVALKKDTPAIRQEVLDWITSKGIDPKSFQIIWKSQK